MTEVDHPATARAMLTDRLGPVQSETVDLDEAMGRVLAEPVVADRDSPPYDVSAMDGYAVRLSDIGPGSLVVGGEVAMGGRPPALPPGQALRITTGAGVPEGTEAIVVREDVTETGESIELVVEASRLRAGQHIRRRGENLSRGGEVVSAGTLVGPQVAAALAAFGCARPRVRRRVRVAVVVTGDELLPPTAAPEPWQIRDSNGPALAAMLAGLPWVETVSVVRARDDLSGLTDRIGAALDSADLTFVTGGVSRGVHDHVPDAVRACGAEVLFHRLPIRPGKPLLGAVTTRGRAVLGLPGNPVSVLIAARWFGVPALRKLAGLPIEPVPFGVRLSKAGEKRMPLFWFRLVRLESDATAAIVPSRGSGDLVASAQSDGFVLVPPNANDEGPWPFTPWRDTL